MDGAARAAAQGTGRSVLVEALAGTGKTALLAAAGRAASDAGLTVLRARGSELEREYAWGVMRQLLEPLLRERSSAGRTLLLKGAAAPAARVVAPSLDPKPGPAADAAALMHALHWLVINASQEGPIMLMVDDAHWSDASSLRALSYLAGRVASLPVAVVVASDPMSREVPTTCSMACARSRVCSPWARHAEPRRGRRDGPIASPRHPGGRIRRRVRRHRRQPAADRGTAADGEPRFGRGGPGGVGPPAG